MSATTPSPSDAPAGAQPESVMTATPSPPPTGRTSSPRTHGWRSHAPRWHRVAEWGIRGVALAAVLAIVLIFVFIAMEALPVFYSQEVRSEVTPGSMWLPQHGGAQGSYVWQPTSEVPKYSIIPLVIGTLKVTAVSILIAAPLAILAAIFVAHIAPRWLRELVKPAIEMLAGVPSVVLGVFALMLLASWSKDAFGFEYRLNAFVAGAALSLAVIPIVFTLSEDALTSVPREFVDASLALGATKMHTLFRVVVPAALPGIVAGIILGFGRAIGETMIVLIASGNAALTDANIGHSTRTITATIAQEMSEVVHGSPHYVALFYLGATLLVFTLMTNVIAQRIAERFRRKRGAT